MTLTCETYVKKAVQDKWKCEATWLVAYTPHRVYVTGSDNMPKTLQNLQLKYISEIRIFNNDTEVKIWQYQGSVCSRELQTGNNDPNVYTEYHILFGDEVKDSKILVDEGYGSRIEFPVDLTQCEIPIRLRIDNIYGYDDDGMIRFKDARFVQFLYNNKNIVNYAKV